MRPLFSDQRGETVLETVLASALFAAVMLMSVAGEANLARGRADARRSTEVELELQQAMDPLLRDISHAWGNPDQGVAPATLTAATPPDPACPGGTVLTLTSGSNRVQWNIGTGGRLIRTSNGQTTEMRGSYNRVCFQMDPNNGRTIRVTISATDSNGREHRLASGATPEGVR